MSTSFEEVSNVKPENQVAKLLAEQAKSRFDEEVSREISSLGEVCASKDCQQITGALRRLLASKKTGKISEDQVIEEVFEAVKSMPSSTLWAFLTRSDQAKKILKTHNPSMARQLASKEITGVDDLLPEDLPWEIFKEYFQTRKEREKIERAKSRRRKRGPSSLKHRPFATLLQDFRARGRKEREAEIDALTMYSILSSERINEGNNGVIFLVDAGGLTKEVREAARQAGILDVNEPDTAIKILKIYTSGASMTEMQNQKRAYEITAEAAKQGEDCAKIPEVFREREIEISNQELRDLFIEATGLKNVGSKIGTIFMEYIEGEDLATYFWKAYAEARQRHMAKKSGVPVDENTIAAIKSYRKFEDIHRYIREMQQEMFVRGDRSAMRLEFADHEPVTPDDFRREAEMDQRNYDHIRKMLEQDGFTIDPSIYDKIRNTVLKFREQGLVYLDAHERNVMLSGDEVYLIDFGKCLDLGRPVEGDTDPEAFAEGPARDMQVVNFLKAFLPKH